MRPRRRLAPLLLLPLMPWTLARAAVATHLLVALLFGVAALSLECSWVLNTHFLSSSDSYATFAEYFLSNWWNSLPCTLLVMGPFMLVVAPLAGGLATTRFWDRMSHRANSRVAAILLSPATALLPMALWYSVKLLEFAPRASFRSGPFNPSWLGSPVLAALASNGWLMVFVLLALANFVLAFFRLGGMPMPDERGRCPNCGYNIASLPPGPCPECGEPCS